MSLKALQQRVATVNDLLCAMSVLVWDSRTMMPASGVESRGMQIATLARLARDILVSDATLRALDDAQSEVAALPADDVTRRAVEQTRRAVDRHARVPAALIERRAVLCGVAHAAWVEARAKSDFSIFAAHLAKTIDAAREYAEVAGYTDHPYDALIDLYEPGETSGRLASLFATLRKGLTPIVAAALARPKARNDFLGRDFSITQQRALARRFAEIVGYDLTRGRLDATVHPFEISFTRHDVRITTRYQRNYLPAALFGAMHEAGHGLYEQNIDPAYTRTALATDLVGLYAVGGASFGAHESQSRLWENHVGRSRAFWKVHFGALRKAFPTSLVDVDADGFYAAVTQTAPGCIRTDADELTYDFHIMLRVEFELALIAGDLKVDGVPTAWNDAMLKHLGVTVQSDAQGCLQDVHWSAGMIGSFCTYTIGNVMAAQLFAAAVDQCPDMQPALERGDYAPLRSWLCNNVWRHGRRFARDELLIRSTGRPLDAAPYIAYLAAKHGAV